MRIWFTPFYCWSIIIHRNTDLNINRRRCCHATPFTKMNGNRNMMLFTQTQHTHNKGLLPNITNTFLFHRQCIHVYVFNVFFPVIHFELDYFIWSFLTHNQQHSAKLYLNQKFMIFFLSSYSSHSVSFRRFYDRYVYWKE